MKSTPKSTLNLVLGVSTLGKPSVVFGCAISRIRCAALLLLALAIFESNSFGQTAFQKGFGVQGSSRRGAPQEPRPNGSTPVNHRPQEGGVFQTASMVRLKQESTQDDEVSQKDIDGLRQQLENATDLDPATATTIRKNLDDAKESLTQISNNQKKAVEYDTDAKSAKKSYEDLEKKLADLKVRNVETGLNTQAIQSRIDSLDIQIKTLKNEITKLENEPGIRSQRRQAIVSELNDANTRKNKVVQDLQNLPIDTDNTLLTKSLEMRLKTQQTTIQSEITRLENEQKKYDAEENAGQQSLIQLETDFNRKTLEFAQTLLSNYEKELEKQRKFETEQDQQEANRKLTEDLIASNEILNQYALRNTEIAEQRESLLQPIADYKAELEATKALLAELDKDFKDSKKRVDEIGLNNFIGQRLRSEKSKLINERLLTSKVAQYKEKHEEIQSKLFDTRELNRETKETEEQFVQDALKSAKLTEEVTAEKVEKTARGLVADRSGYLAAAENDQKGFLKDLMKLYTDNLNLIKQTAEYRDYINERILWIRSNDFILADFSIDKQDWTIFSLERWAGLLGQVWEDIRLTAWFYFLFMAVGVALVLLKPKFRTEITKLGEQAARGSCVHFWPTGRATLLTGLLSLGIPIITFVIGWKFSMMDVEAADDQKMLRALGGALLAATWIYLPMEVLRYVCRPNGLAAVHFHWRVTSIAVIRKNLRWSTPIAAAMTFVISLFFQLDSVHRIDLIERLFFVAAMILLTILLARIFHPESGIFREAIVQNPNSWLSQTQRIWFFAILAVPVFLGLLAIIGYYYTASILVARVYATFVFAFVIVLIRDLLLRFILIRRRDAHIEQAREKREKEKEAAAKNAERNIENTAALGQEQLATIFNQLDVSENAQHSRKLINLALVVVTFIGMWMIWVDVLPAVRMLDRYEVWPGTNVAAAEKNTAGNDNIDSGSDATNPEQTDADTTTVDPATGIPMTTSSTDSSDKKRRGAVTVRDLLVALLIGLFTLLSAQNLPGLLEMLFLKQLPVDQSIRHAFKALVTYAIVLVGIILAFQTVAIGWSQVQWLVTALTFGLAFGLQEIFANFVAGIILLFERPIRIGDVVTVDNVTGVVSKIRTRATTITNWDRKEYVIPNREFITGRLMNWTLSDKVNRLVVNVGVAYGSDVERAKEILLEVCSNHPVVMDNPPPIVTFEAFGASSLDLVVRAYLPDMDNRLMTVDEIHLAINKAFADEGIEIPFPQRDLHVRSMAPEFGDEVRRLLPPAAGGNDSSGNAA